MNISGWAAAKAHAELEPFHYAGAALGPMDVELDISHCGICHSDLHLINDDWQISRYPLVPGHEIIGNVAALGSAVSHLKLDQRVGVGWQRSSCGECEYCRRGDENLCESSQATCVGHHGGFAKRIVVDGRFVFLIPAALDSAQAAPLLCAGVTVFSPLRRHNLGPGMRVGVLGIGGLGHLAVQFAAALGASVTALSSTPAKEKDARQFGTTDFVEVSVNGPPKRAKRSLDFILVTANVDMPWAEYLGLLRPNGTLCFVGVPPSDMRMPVGRLIGGQKSVAGSAIGGRAMMEDMLAYAAQNRIVPRIEALPMAEVNRAVARVATNQARYRMVLENPG